MDERTDVSLSLILYAHLGAFGGGICTKFELIQALMHVLVTCKNEDDSIKNEGARVVTTLFLL